MKKYWIILIIVILLLVIFKPCFVMLFEPSDITYTCNNFGINKTFSMSDDDKDELYELLHCRLFYRKEFLYTKMGKYNWVYPNSEYFTIKSKLGFEYKIYAEYMFGCIVLKINSSPLGSFSHAGNEERDRIQAIVDHYVWYEYEDGKYHYIGQTDDEYMH